MNNKNIINHAAEVINKTNGLAIQYERYKKEVAIKKTAFDNYRSQVDTLAIKIKKVQDTVTSMGHQLKLSTLFTEINVDSSSNLLAQSRENAIFNSCFEEIQFIENYYKQVFQTSTSSLALIFEIRAFLTDQEFIIVFEDKRTHELIKFNALDIEKFITNGIQSSRTDNLIKFLEKLNENSRSIAPELRKLAISLEKIQDNENKIQEILLTRQELKNRKKQIKRFVKSKEKKISPSRQFEMGTLIADVKDIQNLEQSEYASILESYINTPSAYEDTVAMYKYGDTIRQLDGTFQHIEAKMHNGDIALTMVANGIKDFHAAFNNKNAQEEFNALVELFSSNQIVPQSIEEQALINAKENMAKKFKEMGFSIQQT